MTYSVKEIFYTLQGEGFHAGRPALALGVDNYSLPSSCFDPAKNGKPLG